MLVLQYNVLAEYLVKNHSSEYAKTTSRKAHINNTVALIGRLLKKHSFAAIALQEVTASLHNKLQRRFRNYRTLYAPQPNCDMGVCLLYDFSVLKLVSYMAFSLPGHKRNSDKSAVSAVFYHVPSRLRICIAAAHIHYSANAQNTQMMQATTLLQNMRLSAADHYILMCDANCLPSGAIAKLFSGLGYASKVSATINSKLKNSEQFIGCIDYVFSSFPIVSAQVYGDDSRIRPYNNVNCSDHLPLVVSLHAAATGHTAG